MTNFKMTSGATFWYYLVNIFTFGSLYFIKVAALKALVDIQDKKG